MKTMKRLCIAFAAVLLVGCGEDPEQAGRIAALERKNALLRVEVERLKGSGIDEAEGAVLQAELAKAIAERNQAMELVDVLMAAGQTTAHRLSSGISQATNEMYSAKIFAETLQHIPMEGDLRTKVQVEISGAVGSAKYWQEQYDQYGPSVEFSDFEAKRLRECLAKNRASIGFLNDRLPKNQSIKPW